MQFPSLLAWIEYDPHRPNINRLLLSGTTYYATDRAYLAVVGFRVLGAEARSACLALGRLASDPEGKRSRNAHWMRWPILVRRVPHVGLDPDEHQRAMAVQGCESCR